MPHIEWTTIIEILKIITIVGIGIKVVSDTINWLECSETIAGWEDSYADYYFRYVLLIVPVFIVVMILNHKKYHIRYNGSYDFKWSRYSNMFHHTSTSMVFSFIFNG
ncbi:MAG: hypothetical protein J5525_13325 [Lachnospiraceae bacterium]|nr:hypothetical protein [Lachnospiraceae bacterium]